MVAPCKEIQDSLGCWIPHSRVLDSTSCQGNLDSGFQSLEGFQISLRSVPDSKAQYSGLHKQNFPNIPFHVWVITALGKEKSSHNNDNAGRVWSTAVWYISSGRCSFWAPKRLHYCTDYNFLCEEKEHVMIPHNSNKTSWVIFGPHIILQVYMMKSHGGRDNLSPWVLV